LNPPLPVKDIRLAAIFRDAGLEKGHITPRFLTAREIIAKLN
jgi:hypothetical protein